MERKPLRDFIVGLFVLAGLGALAYLSLEVGGLTLQKTGGLKLFADFDETGGLKPRSPVVIAGVKAFRGGGRLKEPKRHPGQPDHVRCPACGEKQAGNALFCEKCGHRLRAEPGEPG